MVNAIAVIGDLFTPAERGKWQGFFGGVFGIASIAGPLVGGWLTDSFSWRWIFYINVPFGIMALVVMFFALPKIRPAYIPHIANPLSHNFSPCITRLFAPCPQG